MHFAKKIIFLLLLIGLMQGSINQPEPTKALTIQIPGILTLDSRDLAVNDPLIAPYKTSTLILSEEQIADFEFTSIGGSWLEIKPPGTLVELEIRFKVNGTWTEWLEIEEEEDIMSDKQWGMAHTKPAESFQYKFILYGDGKNSPVVKDIDFTFIKAAPTVTLEPKPKPRYLSFVALATDPTGVISRSSWGANESYRYLSDPTQDYPLVELDPEFYEKYKDELQYSRVVEYDEDGNKYKWPLQYPESVEKFVIHHTATTSNLDNPAQAIRDIYYYHAMTRGWGDIGYNYLVDLEGNVYEGRYGGEGVIGAHSGPGNHGSIGIAVLGNYQENEVPEEVLTGMARFIYKKSKIHNINTTGFSQFRGELMDNIFGHRDIMNTTCPGDNLYDKIPLLRGISAQNFETKEKFVKNYDYQNLSDLYYIELKPKEVVDVTIKMENIGNKPWNSDTFIVVDQNPEFDGVISFPTKEDVILAKIDEESVEPGKTATFNFQIAAKATGKTVYMNIAPLIDGTTKLSDYIVLPVTVQQPIYQYEFVDASYPPKLIKSDESFSGYIKIKNTGNVPWEGISLKSETFSALPDHSLIEPGETATFNYNFTAPEQVGLKRVSFSPFLEGTNFSNSSAIAFETIVYAREYDAELVAKPLVNDFEQNKNYTLEVTLRNIGSKTWNRSDLSTVFVKAKGFKVSELNVSEQSVSPGDSVNINFTVHIEDQPLGKNFLFLRPKIKAIPLRTTPITINYTVTEQQFQNLDEENQIRVKLSFAGDPMITANGSYEIYAGGDQGSSGSLLTTLSAGKITTVTYENAKYKIDAANTVFFSDQPVRFYPKNSAILQIANYEHRPSWNLDLNDNEYRGVLEVQMDDSLIVINELPLEDYLKGLGEVPDSEYPEKIKAIMIAARSYAKYYMDIDEKFPGKPYNLDDDPNVSQKYLGYGFEKRAPNVATAVEETKGKILTYDGELVKAPYFNQSDGTFTKSALEVWGWTHTPYLQSVDDSFCEGTEFLGHGVGLSGCGAKTMAAQGYTYEEILKYYYTGIEIADLY